MPHMSAGTITWLGHAAFEVISPLGKTALIDPYLSKNPACPAQFKQPKRVDLIVLTHGHAGHVGDTIDLAQQFRCPIVAVVELCHLLEPHVPNDCVRPMNIGGSGTFEGFHITLTPALHSSSFAHSNSEAYAGSPAGIVIRSEGCAPFYHAGDTSLFSDMSLVALLWQPKVVALPIGGHYTMDPKAASVAVDLLRGPGYVIPMHYGTSPNMSGTPGEFALELGKRGLDRTVRILSVQPGQSVAWPAEH